MLSEIPFEPSASSEVIASLPACLRLRRGFSDLELADEPAPDVIRRLNPADGEGRLTNAVGLLLVATPCVGIDYMRRDVPGGDSRHRVRCLNSGPLRAGHAARRRA